ncbi:MAG: hypothetical protein IPI60_08215 [Saprospiraceae bacterium]|nr:hypothetical protein [Saprospiraceae bacterium]
MEFYELETEFTFGKYQGKTLEEVYEIDPAFIDECLIKYDHFNLSDDTLEELKEINPNHKFSEDFFEKREQKFAKWEEENPDDETDLEVDADEFDDDSFYTTEFDTFEDTEEDTFGTSKKKAPAEEADDLDDFEDDFDDDYLSDDFDDYDSDDDY